MAYGRSVSSSSANTSTPPSNATNGNLSDAAKTLSNASPWSYLDLGSTKTVTGIKIYPCGGCVQPTNFSVYSWNGSGWILQVNHPGAMQANAPESLTFPGPVQTQYVLIQINGTSSLEVSEYQVY